MLKLRYVIAASATLGAFVLFSAFGGEKMTQADQLKKIDAIVAENVATFEASKRAECKAMALQKAIGLAEAKLASEKTTIAAPTKKPAAPVKKAPAKTTKPAPAPKPTPAPAPEQPKSKFEKAAEEVKKAETPSNKFKKAAEAAKKQSGN